MYFNFRAEEVPLDGPTSVALREVPRDLRLGPSFPNPFNPRTTLTYSIPQAALVHLGIYDLRGRRVATLVREWQESGTHAVTWDGRTDTGKSAVTGVYLVRLVADTQTASRKIVLIQ